MTALTCAECGYDLRAHGDAERCPECGTAFFSGEVTLEGNEIATRIPWMRYLGRAMGLLCVMIIVMIVAQTQFPVMGELEGARLAAAVGLTLTVGFCLSRVAPIRRTPLRLTLSPSGISLLSGDSEVPRREGWQRGMRMVVGPNVVRATSLRSRRVTGDDRPLGELQILSLAGDKLARFTTRLSAGEASAISRQVDAWAGRAAAALAVAPEDPLERYRSCADCLRPGCTCGRENRDLLIFAMCSGKGPWQLVLVGLLWPMESGIAVRLRGVGDFLAVLAAFVALAAGYEMIRRNRGPGSRREMRFSPAGVQTCAPGAALRLEPWKRRKLVVRPQAFQRVTVGLMHPKTEFIPVQRDIEISSRALEQLRGLATGWAEDGALLKACGFSMS